MSQPPVIHHTLQVRWPAGGVPLRAFILLLIILLGGELAVRNETVQAALLPPLIQGDDQIAVKLLALDREVAKSGRPGCIVIGNSMTWRGIDPDALGQAYEDSFHKPFSCFNFGMRGLDALAAGRLATILAREYHPRLIIYGIHFRDFNSYGNSLVIPWSDYYLGAPTLEGWFEAHFYVFRYARAYSTILRDSPILDPMLTASSKNGFNPLDAVTTPLHDGAVDVREDPLFEDYSSISWHYQIDPRMLAGLEQLVSLNPREVQVVMVEMPIAPGVYEALPRGEQTHQDYVAAVRSRADQQAVPFWQTQDAVIIPNDGWWDSFHLNATGARVFTGWLGQRIAAAIQDGQIPEQAP